MAKKKSKIIFLGTAEFATPFLQALVETDLKPVLVITQPDKPVGRKQELQPSPLKMPAKMAGIKIEQPESKSELNKILKEQKPDVCVLVAYGVILDQQTLDIPQFGFINIHPSLLPKYRGSSPIQAAILNGDEFSGISLMILDDKVDHGPILTQEKLEILPTDTAETLHDRLAILGTEMLIKTLPNYLDGKLKPQPQDGSQASYTKIIKRQDGAINWQNSAEQIERQFRAYFPWPGVFTLWGKKRLKLLNLELLEGQIPADLKPGEVFLGPNNTLAVKCGQGAVKLNRVQIEGKKEMSAEEFLRGNKNFESVILS